MRFVSKFNEDREFDDRLPPDAAHWTRLVQKRWLALVDGADEIILTLVGSEWSVLVLTDGLPRPQWWFP